MDRSFIKEWPSVKSVSIFYCVTGNSIIDCCRGERYDVANYIWRYKNYFVPLPINNKLKVESKSYVIDGVRKYPSKAKDREHNVCKKYILQFDIKGNLIREWPSIKEAADSVNRCSSSIVNCIKGRSKTSAKFIWKYKNT